MSDEFGLTLHHVGCAVKLIEPSVETYTTRFGYEVATPAIHDPLQTAVVQFLKLPGDRAYLEFVAPDGPESVLMAAAKRDRGLNHLCYTCGPLEQTIAQLEETGLRLIDEPKMGVAFGGRRICWLLGEDRIPIELVERTSQQDLCVPGLALVRE